MKASELYHGSDGEQTRLYYAGLESRGPLGVIAMNLFRAQKCSARAKVYRGRYRDMAYDRKGYSMAQLCNALLGGGSALDIGFGWKPDPEVVLRCDTACVLYVDIPTGQVSFHSPTRYAGPDYAGEWDRQRLSAERIIAFCDAVFEAAPGACQFDLSKTLAVATENLGPSRACECSAVMYRNNHDGSRDYMRKGKSNCLKCRGLGHCRQCAACGGAGMLPGSTVCKRCLGSGSVPA
jgi:hypothetical protein